MPNQSIQPGRAATAVQGLSPGYFPFVMATSIISTGAFLLGPSWLSRVLLVIASAGLGVLIVALVIQLVFFRPSMAASWHDPGRVFGFFAIPAAMNVLGIRLTAAGHPLATAILAGADHRAGRCPHPGPSRRACGRQGGGRVCRGFSFALWAFGTWWIPLLIVLGIWRHVREHWPLTYEPALWSVVFPLGMYSVATLTFGKAAHVAFTEPLSRFMFWVALAAWVAVAAALAARIRPAAWVRR